MEKFSNGLTDQQLELLALLSEECGETIQIIGKIIRHGLNSRHPDDLLHSFDNRELLEKEVSHILVAVEKLKKIKLLRTGFVSLEKMKKADSVGQWLRHQ